MLPPRSLLFNVTINAPIHTMTKTSANSGPPSLESLARSEDPCKILKSLLIHYLLLIIYELVRDQTYMAIKVQSTSGPHKSPES